MRVSTVSSLAISKALSYQLSRLQSDLAKGQMEVSSGRHADLGVTLGARTGQAVALNRDIDRLNGLIDTNGLVRTRLDATQEALTALTKDAETLLAALTVGGSSDSEARVLRNTATNALQTLTSTVNTSLNGEYIFAGVNTDVKPINDYGAGGAPNKAAFDAAFAGYFGFAQSDPAAVNITAAQMTDFIDTAVAPLFMGTGWETTWSNASDRPITSRIALGETAETSVSANDVGIRKFAMAATMVSDLLEAPLNMNARAALAERAQQIVGEAIADIQQTQARTGLVQNRVQNASERLSMQVDIMTTNLGELQNVDPYEASTRVNNLLSQIETAYALTARIQQLSLLNYL